VIAEEQMCELIRCPCIAGVARAWQRSDSHQM